MFPAFWNLYPWAYDLDVRAKRRNHGAGSLVHLKAKEWEILLGIGAERPKRQDVTIYQQICHLKPKHLNFSFRWQFSLEF